MATITEPSEGLLQAMIIGADDPVLGRIDPNGKRTWPEVDILGHEFTREGACTRLLDKPLDSCFVVIPARHDHKIEIQIKLSPVASPDTIRKAKGQE